MPGSSACGTCRSPSVAAIACWLSHNSVVTHAHAAKAFLAGELQAAGPAGLVGERENRTVESGKGLNNIGNMKTFKALFGIVTITCGLTVCGYSQSFLTNGLVVYYAFNGNANDASGNGNNGTVDGATLTADRFGIPNSAYYFNGTNSDILVPETLFGATNQAWTISVWITLDSGPYVTLTDIYAKSSVNGEMDLITATNSVQVVIKTASGAYYYASAPLVTNSTIHMVGVYQKGQSLSLYINGVLSDSVALPNEDLWLAAYPLISALGAYHLPPTPFDCFRGTIDDFRVYTRALSASEVQQLYQYESTTGCVPPPAGLVSWWPGEGDANDIAGANNGTLVNGATFAPGEVGQAFSFDGMSSYIRVADNPELHFTNSLTIEAWIYPTSLGAHHNIVSKWDYAIFNAQKSYTTEVGPDGSVVLAICNDGDCSQYATVGSTNSIPVNQWTHFAATYDGSRLWMYVNGVCENQTPCNYSIFPGTGDLLIGAASTGGGQVVSPFAGLIDEPSVYSRALSAAEIQAIYNAGSAGKCRVPFITAQPQGQTVTAGSDVTFVVTAGGTPPLSYQWQFNTTNIAGATGSSLTLTNVQPGQMGNYLVIVSNALGMVTSSNAVLTVISPTCATPPAGLVAWWPGEGNANDIVGTNDGTLEGGSHSQTARRARHSVLTVSAVSSPTPCLASLTSAVPTRWSSGRGPMPPGRALPKPTQGSLGHPTSVMPFSQTMASLVWLVRESRWEPTE